MRRGAAAAQSALRHGMRCRVDKRLRSDRTWLAGTVMGGRRGGRRRGILAGNKWSSLDICQQQAGDGGMSRSSERARTRRQSGD